jgi:hypothetical protein
MVKKTFILYETFKKIVYLLEWVDRNVFPNTQMKNFYTIEKKQKHA